MTALSEYERLEAPGLWRETPEAQRREVVVSFGDATLVLTDMNDKPLAHWSLAAIQRLNPGETTALYSPDDEDTETLEIKDETMITAIEKIRSLIERKRPHPGRLRWGLLGGFIAAILALAIFWLPDTLIRQTRNVIPDVKRQEIGRLLLNKIRRVAGQPCAAPNGAEALKVLGQKLDTDNRYKLAIMPDGIVRTTHLPGGYILLNRALIEDFEEPDVAAGYILAEQLRAEQQDPLDPLLHSIGLRATFTLLTTGELPAGSLDHYAEMLATTPPAKVPDEALLAKFKAARLRSSPYAFGEDPTGETTLPLIEADPFPDAAPEQLLSDNDWISLQSICEE